MSSWSVGWHMAQLTAGLIKTSEIAVSVPAERKLVVHGIETRVLVVRGSEAGQL